MKKVKTILMAVAVVLIYSCSKSDESISPQDGPHRKDTTITNTIPHIALNN